MNVCKRLCELPLRDALALSGDLLRDGEVREYIRRSLDHNWDIFQGYADGITLATHLHELLRSGVVVPPPQHRPRVVQPPLRGPRPPVEPPPNVPRPPSTPPPPHVRRRMQAPRTPSRSPLPKRMPTRQPSSRPSASTDSFTLDLCETFCVWLACAFVLCSFEIENRTNGIVQNNTARLLERS